MTIHLKRLVFFWACSFGFATLLYYLLSLILPDGRVFASLFRMRPYHLMHPIAFIAIPCFFYGILATILARKFQRANNMGKTWLTAWIIVTSVLVSSPFGGMLWYYYDMQAGFFPQMWFSKMVEYGTADGLECGWYIVADSTPYNIIGAVICFFLTRWGSKIPFQTKFKTQ